MMIYTRIPNYSNSFWGARTDYLEVNEQSLRFLDHLCFLGLILTSKNWLSFSPQFREMGLSGPGFMKTMSVVTGLEHIFKNHASCNASLGTICVSSPMHSQSYMWSEKGKERISSVVPKVT